VTGGPADAPTRPALGRLLRGGLAWVESRTGLVTMLGRALDERIPGGARWAYVFGSALLALLLAQLLSGLALALSYSPSVGSAWASVARLELSPLGHLLRGLHAHGATFTIAVVALHLLQTALYGAYRAPREVTWWLGLCLLGVVLAFALTGSLLPWDERGYWATRVTAGIVGTVPVAGARLSRAMLGGPELGNLSLTRFYALHAIALPLLLLLLATAHVTCVRRHGVTPPPSASPREEPFWPRQALYDAGFSLLLLAALLALSLKRGAPLGAPADPAGAGSPRPEWYFRPLFHLLALVPGSLETAATVGVPLLAAAFLALLPFLDGGARRRKPVLAVLLGGFAAAAALGITSYLADANSPAFQREQIAAERRAQKALRLSRAGVPPEGGLALLHGQPEERGRLLFAARCLECHRLGGEGRAKAPALDGYLSKAWIAGVLAHPSAPDYFGQTKIRGMESFEKLGPEKLSLLADFLVSLREVKGGPESFAPKHDAGRRVYEQAGCADCHSLEPGKQGLAPTLARYGSAEWLRGMVHDPGSPLYYDGDNEMPAFGKALAARDIDDLVAYLGTLAVPEEQLAQRP
jgi:ubiquinol-cytochrome c reductase cytochrome b subunit